LKNAIRFLSFVLVLSVLYHCSTMYANEGTGEIFVYLDGERLEFDVMPMIIDGRTMVPMRVIFEALDAPLRWYENRQMIFTSCDRYSITFQIGNPLVTFWTRHGNAGDGTAVAEYGFDIELDVPPQIVDGRTLVPLRAISEIFDAVVEWDAGTRNVLIDTIRSAVDFEAVDEGFRAPIPRQNYWRPLPDYDDVYYVTNRIILYTTNPVGQSREAIESVVASIYGEIIGISAIGGSFVVQIPPRTYEELLDLGEHLITSYPHLFRLFFADYVFIESDDEY